jgi:hypothetical protein
MQLRELLYAVSSELGHMVGLPHLAFDLDENGAHRDAPG